ncbi:MAG: SRPBCC domain-containing protein [Acidobacteria bacterium]|nr:SRPBCC domain-containing protein [Acidobacteriota bacterium]
MKRATVALGMIAVLVGRVSAQDTSPIVSEGVVEASVEAVWTAWTANDALRAWLAPHAEIDLRLGGLMRTNYNPQGALGDAQTIENTILSFEPGRMISIRVAKFPDGFPFPNAVGEMWTAIYFETAGQGRTRVRIGGLGFRADEESQRMRAFFDRGNAATLRHLQHHFSPESR